MDNPSTTLSTIQQPPPQYTKQQKPIRHHHGPKYDRIGVAIDDVEGEGEDNDDDGLNHDHRLTSTQPPLSQDVPLQQRLYCDNNSCCYHRIILRYIQRYNASFLTSFLCGQCIAMIVTSMNTSSYLLISKHQVHTNFFQLFFVYILLTILNHNYYEQQHHHHDSNTTHHYRNNNDGSNLDGIHDTAAAAADDDDDDDNEVEIHNDDDSNNKNDTKNWNEQSHRIEDDNDDNNINGNNSNSVPVDDLNDNRSNVTTGSRESSAVTIIPTATTITPTLYRYSILLFNCREGCWTNYTVLQLHVPIYYYMLLSMMDILSNVLSIYSFHYTTLTSTTLLGSISIPSTMFFARILLRKVFTPIQYIGIVLCIIGGCYTIYIDAVSDTDVSNDTNVVGYNNNNTGYNDAPITTVEENTIHDAPSGPPPQQYIGDIMALTAALLYGLGDCIAEYAIKYINRKEYLYMIGMFGMIFTAMIVPIFEYNSVKELFTNTVVTTTIDEYDHDGNQNKNIIHHVKIISLFIWFIASVTLYYMIEAIFLLHYDATLLNLSMQSVNLWAYMIMYLINPDGVPSSNFFIALFFVVTGVCLYEMGSTSHDPYVEVQRSNDTDIGESSNMNSTFNSCSHQDSQIKPRRDSEVEIVHGPNIQAPVNYQSLQLVRSVT